jgi:hypothetical protein
MENRRVQICYTLTVKMCATLSGYTTHPIMPLNWATALATLMLYRRHRCVVGMQALSGHRQLLGQATAVDFGCYAFIHRKTLV